MNIGITGGQGFIGYHTYYNLKFTTDWNIIKLDRDFANLTNINKGAKCSYCGRRVVSEAKYYPLSFKWYLKQVAI